MRKLLTVGSAFSINAWAAPESLKLPPELSTGNHLAVTNPLTVVLALLFIVGLIFLMAWLVKRLSKSSFTGNQPMKTLASLSVGSRERVVLIDVAGQQLLVGVAPGRVSPIHTFAEPVVDSSVAPSAFAAKFQDFLQPTAASKSKLNE